MFGFLHKVINVWSDSPNCPRLRLIQVRRETSMLYILFEYWNEKYKVWSRGGKIVINTGSMKIVAGNFFGRGNGGWNDVGFGLVTFPLALILLPMITLKKRQYEALERQHGMHRIHIAFLEALKSQLTHDVKDDLEKVFKVLWRSRNYHRHQ